MRSYTERDIVLANLSVRLSETFQYCVKIPKNIVSNL